MIDGIKITVRCDHLPCCQPFKTDQDGPEIDFELLEKGMKYEGWIVADDEHICPGCADDYQLEQESRRREAERDERMDDPRNAPGYAAYVARS